MFDLWRSGPMVYDFEVPTTQETLQSKASPILQQLQAALVSHRFAPFRVRQLTVTRQQNNMQVKSLLSSLAVMTSRPSILQNCKCVVAT